MSKATGGGGSAVYCLGLLGALYYFLHDASGFQDALLGVLQSIVWPAIFVYKAFEFLGY